MIDDASPAAETVEAPGAAAKADPTKLHIVNDWAHESPLIACRFDPAGKFVFASAEDNSVQRWDLASGEKVAFQSHDSWVRGIEFSNDGNTMISAGCDGRLIWWPASEKEPQPIRRINAHIGWIRYIARSPDGKYLASAGTDNLAKLWNLETGELIKTFTGHEKHVYSVLFHPDGQHLLSGDLAGKVKQWEIATGNMVREFDATKLHTYNGGQQVDFGGVRSMAISPDGKQLACSGLHEASNPLGAVHDPLVMIFDWESQQLVRSHIAEGLKGVAWRVVYHPDGFLIGGCGGSSGGFILFWKSDEDKDFHRLKMPHLTRDIDLHGDQLRIATSHYDKHIRISSLTEKQEG